jgi:hypothetical protein
MSYITFTISHQLEYGEGMILMGSDFGNWDISQGHQMKWSTGHHWTVRVELTPSQAYIEYKYVVVKWE